MDIITRCAIKCFHLLPGDKPNALAEPRGEEESLTKKGKKKKTVHWAEEEQLKHYFYFDLDETERGRTRFAPFAAASASRSLSAHIIFTFYSSVKHH